MICHNCNKDVNEDVKVCPYCDFPLDEDMELPHLKDEDDILLEKTRVIRKDDTTSLEDDILNQFNDSNEEMESNDIVNEEVVNNELDLRTNESLVKRKNSLVFALCITLLFLGLCFGYIIMNNSDSVDIIDKEDDIDISSIDDYLMDYYYDNNIDGLVNILDSISEDDIDDVSNKCYLYSDNWLSEYLNKDFDSKEDLLGGILYVTDKIDRLYDLDNDGNKLLSSSNYKLLIDKINVYSNDGNLFYEAVDMYNGKAYNEAYYVFSRVSKDNIYYGKVDSYLSNIIDDVMNLLMTDINKLEIEVNESDYDSKIVIYNNIYEVIKTYNIVYDNLELNKNIEYIELLESYGSKANQ